MWMRMWDADDEAANTLRLTSAHLPAHPISPESKPAQSIPINPPSIVNRLFQPSQSSRVFIGIPFQQGFTKWDLWELLFLKNMLLI